MPQHKVTFEAEMWNTKSNFEDSTINFHQWRECIWCLVSTGLEIRHFEKNSNSRKCQTQGNAKLKEKLNGKNLKNSRKKFMASANFTPTRLKIMPNWAHVCSKRKMNFDIFQKSAISKGIRSETRANPIENCKQSNNTLKS